MLYVMEDTTNWLKSKINIKSDIKNTETQENKEVVSPIVKKSTTQDKKSTSHIIIPKKANIGEIFKIDFDKEYSYVKVTISNGIRMEVPNAVWNAHGKEEEVGSPLIDFIKESETEKWGSVEIPMISTQRVHGEINILKPEQILIQVTIKGNNEEHNLHEKIQLN